MSDFSRLLSLYRRQAGISQEALGAMLGTELDDTGFSGAAISSWERGVNRIDKDDRPILVSLIKIFHKHQCITHPYLADLFLHAGNYRSLNADEARCINEGWMPQDIDGNDIFRGVGKIEANKWSLLLRRKGDGVIFHLEGTKLASAFRKKLQSSILPPPPNTEMWAILTERERDIASALVSKRTVDLTNAGLALEMGISTNTLRKHLRSIYAKLGVSSRAALVHLLMQPQNTSVL